MSKLQVSEIAHAARGALLLPVLLAACQASPWTVEADTTSPAITSDAPVRTRDTRYKLRTAPGGIAVEIPYTYTNTNPDTVYFVNCNQFVAPSLQKHTPQGWVQSWVPATTLCLSPPIIVAPGRTYSDTVHVFAGDPQGNTFPKFEHPELDGTYRLLLHRAVFHYNEQRQGFGDSLAIAQRISNPFALEIP